MKASGWLVLVLSFGFCHATFMSLFRRISQSLSPASSKTTDSALFSTASNKTSNLLLSTPADPDQGLIEEDFNNIKRLALKTNKNELFLKPSTLNRAPLIDHEESDKSLHSRRSTSIDFNDMDAALDFIDEDIHEGKDEKKVFVIEDFDDKKIELDIGADYMFTCGNKPLHKVRYSAEELEEFWLSGEILHPSHDNPRFKQYEDVVLKMERIINILLDQLPSINERVVYGWMSRFKEEGALEMLEAMTEASWTMSTKSGSYESVLLALLRFLCHAYREHLLVHFNNVWKNALFEFVRRINIKFLVYFDEAWLMIPQTLKTSSVEAELMELYRKRLAEYKLDQTLTVDFDGERMKAHVKKLPTNLLPSSYILYLIENVQGDALAEHLLRNHCSYRLLEQIANSASFGRPDRQFLAIEMLWDFEEAISNDKFLEGQSSYLISTYLLDEVLVAHPEIKVRVGGGRKKCYLSLPDHIQNLIKYKMTREQCKLASEFLSCRGNVLAAVNPEGRYMINLVFQELNYRLAP